ncbi:hypothetical protein [Jannaschia pohangensis]|uniref:Uncharacterized protein n=1 Tax=Jannaschia pohangensis TaxID=390807 RepID=A0A1I3ITC4_9RHOB|nr:hypothetical protein [Jannaschia pohangensis]SFI51205.1 hypothetical protein SAMN04488095_1091 [Jannaschia pohangensis]
MTQNRMKIALGMIAAMATGGAAFADAHISVGDATGDNSSVSIQSSTDGGTPSLSMSVSNGDRQIDIDSGALGSDSGAGRAEEALDGLGNLSVQSAVTDDRAADICELQSQLIECR